MKFNFFSRNIGKKGEINEARREGKIPAILYGPKQTPLPIYITKEELEANLRKLRPGTLSTTPFELEEGGKKFRALVKEIQYHRTTYAPEHIDFILVQEDVPVTVNVPIRLAGLADCVGVKLGGFARHLIRHLKVRCLPKEIPSEFVLDVKEMKVADSRRLSDIVVPQGVRPMAKMNEVAVVIAKKG